MKTLSKSVKEQREISKIIERIKTIEKNYGIKLTKRACQRYSNQRSEENRLIREIAQREKELQQLKRKAK